MSQNTSNNFLRYVEWRYVFWIILALAMLPHSSPPLASWEARHADGVTNQSKSKIPEWSPWLLGCCYLMLSYLTSCCCCCCCCCCCLCLFQKWLQLLISYWCCWELAQKQKKTSTCPQVQSAMIITNFLSYPSPTKTTESIVYSHAWIDNLVQSCIDITV